MFAALGFATCGVAAVIGLSTLASCQTTLLEAGAGRYRAAVAKAVAAESEAVAARADAAADAAADALARVKKEAATREAALAEALDELASERERNSEEGFQCPDEAAWSRLSSCPSPW